MQIEDGIYGALVGLEGVVINRDRVDDFFQKRQRGIDVFMPVKRNKASCK